MKQKRFFFISYLLSIACFIFDLKSLIRLHDQAQRDAIFRENRIEEDPFGFPPQPTAEPTKITSEAVREITSEMSARIEDDKDTQFLFWSVLLGFAGFLAVICIQSKYSQPSAENLPG
jgi:hypothetical protein